MKEFTKGLRDYGLVVDASVVKQLFSELDADGSGSLDFDEFLEALRVRLLKNGTNWTSYDVIAISMA